IGTILMVAITVILTIVAVSFTFGMTSELRETKTPMVLAERLNETNVRLMLANLGNAREVKSCRILPESIEGSFDLEIGVPVILELPRGYYSLVCEVDNVEQIIWTGRI
ncbi:MAG: type IV pilin, partial [Archaeoglobaceae archaeon]